MIDIILYLGGVGIGIVIGIGIHSKYTSQDNKKGDKK